MKDEILKLSDEFYHDLFYQDWKEGQDKKIKQATEDEQLVIDYANTFYGSDHGKRVLSDILRHGHILEDIFHPSSRMPFLVGERNLALYIYHMAKADSYLRKLKEQTQANVRNNK